MCLVSVHQGRLIVAKARDAYCGLWTGWFVCSGVLGWQKCPCSGSHRHEVSLIYSRNIGNAVVGCVFLLLFLQNNFCDLRPMVDNRCSVDTHPSRECYECAS